MKISIVLGTRPEATKLAPLIRAIKKESDLSCHVCVTAQHRQMLDQVLGIFEIISDVDPDIIKPSQTLSGLSARAIEAVDAVCLVLASRPWHFVCSFFVFIHCWP